MGANVICERARRKPAGRWAASFGHSSRRRLGARSEPRGEKEAGHKASATHDTPK